MTIYSTSKKSGTDAGRKRTRPLPFKVHRDMAANLSDQVADGLRQAILTGYYRKGEALPNLEEIAATLGVSLRIPREAIARLATENLVSPRPRLGCIVLGRRETLWRGRVLAIVSDFSEGSFHSSILIGELRRRLAASGYLLDTATVARRGGGKFDAAALDLALRERADFIFPLHCPAALHRRLDALGLPWATFERRSEGEIPSPFGDLSPFLHQCETTGVRRILLAGYGSLDFHREIQGTIEAAGIEVESIRIHTPDSATHLERLERSSMRFFLERFSQSRETWPDLIFWTDDFLAFGGLTALLELGVRIPGDVFAVTQANKGFAPVYPRSIARFEFDPVAAGRAAADNIIARLAGGEPGPLPFKYEYLPGQSFPKRRK